MDLWKEFIMRIKFRNHCKPNSDDSFAKKNFKKKKHSTKFKKTKTQVVQKHKMNMSGNSSEENMRKIKMFGET